MRLPKEIRVNFINAVSSVFPVVLTGQNFFESVKPDIWKRVVPVSASFRDGVEKIIVAAEREGWLDDLVRSLIEKFPARSEFRDIAAELARQASENSYIRKKFYKIRVFFIRCDGTWPRILFFGLAVCAITWLFIQSLEIRFQNIESGTVDLVITRRDYNRALAAKRVGDNSSSAEVLVRDTTAYDQVREVVSQLNDLLRLWPNLDKAIVGKAHSEVKFGRLEALFQLLREVAASSRTYTTKQKRDAAKLGYLVGRFATLTADLAKAEIGFRIAVDLDPTSLLASRALAAHLVEQGDLAAALKVLDVFLNFNVGEITNTERAEALTKRAEVHLWARRLLDASDDIDAAINLMGDGSSGSDGAFMPLATALNIASALKRQLGDLKASREFISRSMDISGSSNGNIRANIAATINRCAVEARSGLIAEAAKRCTELIPRTKKLPEGDRLRGYLEIALSDIDIRQFKLLSATTHLDAADDFFPLSESSRDNMIRRGMIKCYRQKIAFFSPDNTGSDGEENCLNIISDNNAGLVDMQLDSLYIQCKIFVKSGKSLYSFDKYFDNISNIVPKSSLMRERINIAHEICLLTPSLFNKIDVDEGKIGDLSRRAARLEKKSGALLELLDDILMFKHGINAIKNPLRDLDELNSLRRSIGASEYQIN